MNTRMFLPFMLLALSVVSASGVQRQLDKVRNVILMIPDGTSIGVMTLARWYNENKPLNIDPYLCGLIRTYSIDNRIPDSAPTSTAYATGVKTRAPFIGVDSSEAPRISVLELARMKGLATGEVVTCEFPHATPADFVCHFNNRESRKYENLVRQFIYNSPSVVFAGGKSYLMKNNCLDLLAPNNIRLMTTLAEFDSVTTLPSSGKRLWWLFPDWRDSTKSLAFECDRDPAKAPSLSQMTDKALGLLKQHKKGFFLMVEGSQVDWAAHYNDPYAAVTDFLEFDKAVGRAIDFAKKDSHTVVIVCPDHSTGGLSVGNFQSGTDILGKSQDKYENINIRERIVDSLAKIRWSGRKLAEKMLSDRSYVSADSIFNYYHLMPSKELMAAFDSVSKIKTQESLVDTLQQMLGSAFSRRHFIGWTTTGHTAEDVFLAICAPRGIERKMGVIENGEVGKYIASLLCLGNLIDSTRKYFCSHKELFSAGEVTVSPDSLVISRNNRKGVVKKNTTILRLDGKEVRLPTIAVFINEVYYVPKKITDYFK